MEFFINKLKYALKISYLYKLDMVGHLLITQPPWKINYEIV